MPADPRRHSSLLRTLRRLLPGWARRGGPPPSIAAPDPFAAGLFPICPATHDLGLRWLFDLSTLLMLLDCRPGDRVLDLGAGSGFSSEMLARFGYDVVALDPDRAALAHNRRRPRYDRSRIEGTVRVVQGVAEGLPFHDRRFDGIFGMNVMHHVPDLPLTLSELARVLKPGCRAVFSEPGLEHLETAHTQRAIRELGEDDRAFDVLALLGQAREHGFQRAMLAATLYPPLRLLPIDEVETYLTGAHPRAPLTPAGVMEELHRRHPFGMLVRDGVRVKTSRYPGLLQCELTVETVPMAVRRGRTFVTTIHAKNIGDSTWLAEPKRRGGYVTAGCKFLTESGRLLTDRPGRTCLTADVAPGETTRVEMRVRVPRDLPAGACRLQFDLVDELVCWFSDASAEPPVTHPITVE